MRILKRSTLFMLLSIVLVAASAFAQQVTTVAPSCPLHGGQTLTITSSGTTEVIAVPTSKAPPIFINGTATVNPGKPRIMICGVQIQVNQAVGAADYGLVAGTGTACATGQTNLTPQWQGTASIKEIRDTAYGFGPLIAPPGNAVCLKLSAAPTGARILIQYNIIA